VYELIVNGILEELRIQGCSTMGTGGIGVVGAVSLFHNGGGSDGVTKNSDNNERSPSSALLSMAYTEFISRVMLIMNKMKGNEFTIQMGELYSPIST